MSSITVTEFDSMVEKIFDLKKEIEADEEKVAEKQRELDSLKAKTVLALKEQDRDSYKCPYGQVTITEKWRVKLPSEDSDKAALFEHLRSRGIFEKYATVNANSLNSLYMQDWEAAKKAGEGMEFRMPGIGEPSLFEALHLTKGKS